MQSMPTTQTPRILKAFTRVDSRTCGQCGSRYNHCDHTRGQSCEDVIWLPKADKTSNGRKIHLWEKHEDELLRRYVTETKFHYGKIADLMNKTRSACVARASRLGLVRPEC